MREKLGLSKEKIAEARELASRICAPVLKFVDEHSSVTVERATLRLAGADDADADGVPVPNLVVDQARDRLEDGALRLYVGALARTGDSPEKLNRKIAEGLRLSDLPPADEAALARKAEELVRRAEARVRGNREHRDAKQAEWKDRNHRPLLYLIVATGNIYEDVKQATAAAQQGADVIAVIRTTAQSLLDYVPYGPTTEGFGGTYATQENFRIMRAALDEVAEKEKRYIRLTNYASGLCMPEIAAMGALERLDMMLNDSMYGILFRDINMYRTFVDQKFSRMINAYAGIIINTGEDNYLTTSDAYREGLHRAGQPVPQRALRLSARASSPAHGPGARLRDGSRHQERLPVRTGSGADGPRDLSRASAEVHAAHQVHVRRHLQGPRHEHDVQLRVQGDRTRASTCWAC